MDNIDPVVITDDDDANIRHDENDALRQWRQCSAWQWHMVVMSRIMTIMWTITAEPAYIVLLVFMLQYSSSYFPSKFYVHIIIALLLYSSRIHLKVFFPQRALLHAEAIYNQNDAHHDVHHM